MWILELIYKKQHNQKLTKAEIDFVVSEFNNGNIPDYQMSSFLMAIWFKGLDQLETTYLTKALINSGDVLNLSAVKGFKADKHSTGGIGDKVSLIYGPLLASFGIKVAKISGKGLGQTGGTIDKLEAIPNFRTNLTWKEFIDVINKCNMSIISQTQDFTPADRKIYALRDATSTVDSIPLIAASIMAKKLVMGSDGIVLDVKCGNGAFMTNIEDANKLATSMLNIAKQLNVKASAIITDMNQPLGRMIGNICEVQEAYDFLQGIFRDEQLLEIVTTLTAMSLVQAKQYLDIKTAKKAALEKLNTKEPLKVFEKFIMCQDGDLDFLVNKTWKQKIKYQIFIKASKSGYVNITNCYGLGTLAMQIGAGRKNKADQIDYMAGIFINRKTGEKVEKGDTIFTLFTNINNEKEFMKIAATLYTIIDFKPKVDNIILQDNFII